MTSMGQHEIPQRKRDRLLWAAAAIAACTMLEVWGSWLQIGSVSGFPRFGSMTTGWILPVSTEAYWACALVGWLGSAPGSRSRRFAMWSAAGMFALSLGGQESAHLLAAAHRSAPPAAVVGFVSALPLVALALIAVLVHLRRADTEAAGAAQGRATEAAQLAAQERAEADERSALRAEVERLTAAREADLSALREQLAGEIGDAQAARDTAQRDLETARGELAEALRRAEALTAKLATVSAQKKRAKAPASARAGSGESDPTNELLAVMELQLNPKLLGPRMSGELARALGLSPATGRRLYGKLVTDGALSEYAQSLTRPLGERSL
jgi:hypothetical protein